MESSSSHNLELTLSTLRELREAAENVRQWNAEIADVDDYMTRPDGSQKLAASCMLILAIGEGIKKIDNSQNQRAHRGVQRSYRQSRRTAPLTQRIA